MVLISKYKYAEIFLPSSGTSCTLPNPPHRGGNHFQWNSDTGSWQLVILDVGRENHVSWTPGTGIGTYLMGAGTAEKSETWKTTTLVKPDGTKEPGFPLKYDT